jgi:DNA polymerase I
MANKIRFFPLDVTYKIIDNRAVILLFGRTVDGKQISVMDTHFEPYFYVVPAKGHKIEEKLKKIRLEKNGAVYSVTKIESVKKKLLGKDVDALKVYTNLPQAVPVIRETIKEWNMIGSINEYDILFTRRYLIDRGITPLTLVEVEGNPITQKSKVPVINAEKIEQFSDDTIKKPRILTFDIETYNPLGKSIIPEKHPIIMVGFYGENYRKVITWKHFKTKEDYIDFVKSEADLINRFKDVIETYNPDIISGYFSDGFDLPYLEVRAKKYKIKLDLGLDFSQLKIRRGRKVSSQFIGLVHLDTFRFIQKVVSRSLETDSYSLDAVAQELLGEKKQEVDLNMLAKVWDREPDKLEEFCKYNLRDAQLTFKIFKKILPQMIELVKIVGLPIYEINRMGFSQLVEWYLIKQASHFNEITPNKPHHEEIRERRLHTYEGGFVYEPKPGLYKKITIFDYRSLYPTIITSHNISLGTLNCDCCEGSGDYAPLDNEKYWFCRKKKGFIPTVIEDLITRRMRIKEILKKEKDNVLLNARSEGLKVLANSFYGYLGFFGARWYNIECAKSVTAWGRYYIHEVIDKAKKSGFNVIYSDTDSVFLTLDGKTKEEAEKFAEAVNIELPGIMELEYEGFYPSGIFVSAKAGVYGAKKKYALLGEDNTIKIRGFETVRRNWSIIAKNVQRKVLEIILKEGKTEEAAKYVRKVINDLREHKIPLDEVIIFTQLQKDVDEYDSIGPHVAVAKRMRSQGLSIGPGSLIKFVVAKGKGRIRDRARLVEEVTQEDYDPEYYIKNQILPSVDRIFMVLGYKEEQLLETKNQSRLEGFF